MQLTYAIGDVTPPLALIGAVSVISTQILFDETIQLHVCTIRRENRSKIRHINAF